MAFASLRHPDVKISSCTGRCELRGRLQTRSPFSLSAFSHHHTTPRLSPQGRRDSSRDPQLVRDAAKLFVIIKAVAATKLYQASTMRAVATSTAMLTQAIAPYAPDAPPHDLTTIAANSNTATQTSLSPEPQPVTIHHPQQITLNDTLLEAALWTDELQDMQARRKQLQADLEELTQQLRLTLQPSSTSRPTTTSVAASSSSNTTNPAVTSSQAEEYFVSFGPEFCGLTCKVEADAEIEQLRSALRQQIHTLSSHLLARASASPQPLQVMQMQFMDRVLDPMPVAKPSPSQAQVKKLQKQWNAAALDVTHLLVRIAQMQQLPAVPKARVTVAHVKQQVINHLHDRRAYLAQDDDI